MGFRRLFGGRKGKNIRREREKDLTKGVRVTFRKHREENGRESSREGKGRRRGKRKGTKDVVGWEGREEGGKGGERELGFWRFFLFFFLFFGRGRGGRGGGRGVGVAVVLLVIDFFLCDLIEVRPRKRRGSRRRGRRGRGRGRGRGRRRVSKKRIPFDHKRRRNTKLFEIRSLARWFFEPFFFFMKTLLFL